MTSQITTELPHGWRVARVGEILKIRNGYAFKSTDYQESGAPLIRQSELRSDVVDTSEAKRVDPRFLTELSGFTIREGDLLIGMSGSLGKIAEYQEKEPALQNQRTGLLLLKSGYDAKFAKLVLKFVEPQIVAEGKGVAVQNVSAKEIEDCTFALPSPDEQRRIVAEIEKQFTRLEAGVAALRRVQANLKRYRAAVLKAACEGRLVPTEAELHRKLKTKNSKLETGAQLLARILTERRQNWQGRGQYKQPAAPDTEKLASLPDGWTQATVEQLTSLVATGATPLRGKSDFWNAGNIPWVTSGALNDDFVTEAFEFITPLAIQKTNAKLFPAGTLLVALYGEGKTRGKVSELKIEAATNQACAALLFSSANSAMRPYLKVFLQNNYEAVRLLASGGVQPNLSLSIMKNTIVPLPPLAEQTRIVAEVERRLSVVEELESVVSANLQRATRLRQSILQKAFTGEL